MNERKRLRLKTKQKMLERQVGEQLCKMQIMAFEEQENTYVFAYHQTLLQHLLMEYLKNYNELKYTN